MPDGHIVDIEDRVERDRAALARSLDQLNDTLDPARLKAEATRAMETYGTDISRQVWGAARENPAAFALVGAGLALLLSGAGRRDESDRRPGPAAVPPEQAMDGFDARVAAADARLRHDATGRRSDAPSSGRMRAALHRGLEALPPKARTRVLEARQAAIRAQESVERRATQLGRRAESMARDQPLTVAAAAFGLGAVVAAVLPNTRQEDELLSAKRDDLMGAAQDALTAELQALKSAAGIDSDPNTANHAEKSPDLSLQVPS